MAEYIDKKRFLDSMGLTGDETKYGNRDAEHQHRSYSTYMSYEITDCVEDSIVEEELVPVKHGYWKWNIEHTRPFCSNCAEEPWRKNNAVLPNYCPNCGARMDGE